MPTPRQILTAIMISAVFAACDPEPAPVVDADSDGILDSDEGTADTDGDGLLDVEDPDSDNDGIPDSVEAGDDNPDTAPDDADADGTPNFQDLDSDDNGILDADEGVVDTDVDGRLDAFDPDDDADGIFDVVEMVGGAVVDTDADGVADFKDSDSDNDGIPDREEGNLDADRDGIPNFREVDSDGDGFLDGAEGSADFDLDGIPNFADLDSDNDGLADAIERQIGSSPTDADSDNDGFTDLVEQVILEQCLLSPETCNGSPDPLNPNVGVSDQDFVFVLPFNDPPQDGDLSFATDVQVADIHFSVDTTSSMGQELNNLKVGLGGIINAISDPAQGIPNTAFGVSRFEDFPVDPYGVSGAGDVPYKLEQRVTTDAAQAQAGVNALTIRNGGDIPESGNEALFQIATGAGLGGFLAPFNPGAGFDVNRNGIFGGVGFREGALPIVIQVTDALAHSTDAPATLTCNGGIQTKLQYGQDGQENIFGTRSRGQVLDALQDQRIRVIGIASNEQPVGTACSPRGDLEQVARETGALVPVEAFTDANGNRPAGCAVDQCCTGVNGVGRASEGGLCPLVFDVNADGSGEFAGSVITAVRALSQFAVLDVSALRNSQQQLTANGDFIDPAAFIKNIVALSLNPNPNGGANIDPVTQTFLDVLPGTVATFGLTAENDFLPQAPVTQVFTLQIDVLGDGVTNLDTRQVVIIVPALIEDEEG